MRRGNLFWGSALLLMGVLFLLQSLGYIKDVAGYIWPLFLVLAGIFVLTGSFGSRHDRHFHKHFEMRTGSEDDFFGVDLQNAAKVEVDFDHGGGSVRFVGGAPADKALVGTQGTAMSFSDKLIGDTLKVDVDAGPSFLPFIGPEQGSWDFQLNSAVPLVMKVDAGAADLSFDFSDTKLTNLDIDCGASTLKIVLPSAAGSTAVNVECGASTLDITVPDGVAIQLNLEQGVSTVKVDETRFPKLNNGLYQSADFDSAKNKVVLKLEGGVNTVNVN